MRYEPMPTGNEPDYFLRRVAVCFAVAVLSAVVITKCKQPDPPPAEVHKEELKGATRQLIHSALDVALDKAAAKLKKETD